MGRREQYHEGLFIQRHCQYARLIEGQRNDDDIEIAVLESFTKDTGVVLFDDEAHLGRHVRQCRDEVGKQVGPYRVDRAHTQRSGKLVLALLGQLTDTTGLFENALGLGYDLLTHGRESHFAAPALEYYDFELFFQFLDGDTERRLTHITGFSCLSEMALPGHGDDISQFSERH